jgi:hypothetical protein
MAFWSTIFPGQIPEHPIVPDALDGDVINLEGHELRIITVGQSDTAPSTIVYIPSLDAVISGDVAYNGIHQWLAQTDHEKRMQWIASVEQIEALKPKIVIAGHKRPDARDDHPRPHQELHPRPDLQRAIFEAVSGGHLRLVGTDDLDRTVTRPGDIAVGSSGLRLALPKPAADDSNSDGEASATSTTGVVGTAPAGSASGTTSTTGGGHRRETRPRCGPRSSKSGRSLSA